MKSKTLIWVIVVAIAVVAAVLLFRPSSGGVQNVDAAGAQAAIEKGAQIIDVRTAGEFQMGHIPGAVNTPVDQVQAAAQSWDRDSTYVVYCATGARSATAVETMRQMGFKNIAHLAAGIQAWQGKLDTGGQTSNQKIPTAGKPVFIEFFTDS